MKPLATTTTTTITAAALAACLGLAGAAHADTLVSFDASPDHVTADATFHTIANGSNGLPYADGNDFEDDNPLSPTTGYTGPTFYGGYRFTSSAYQSGFTREQVRNYTSPAADQIFLQSYRSGGWSGSTLSLQGVYIFKQADFNAGYQTGAIDLQGLSMTWVGYINTADDQTPSFNGHFVVQVGGAYYLSQTTIDLSSFNGSFSLSGTQLADERWAVYDPKAALDFDADSASYNAMDLTGVTAVGIYFEEDGWAGPSSSNAAYGLGITSFQAAGDIAVVPEPAALGAWGVGAACLAGVSRRRSRSTRPSGR